MQNRYIPQGTGSEFEPGSRNRVLRNLGGVRSVRQMERLESQRLYAATQRLIDDTAPRVPQLMARLENEHLRRFTPCLAGSLEEQARSLAVVHAELVLIHPFREGNGRCARLLSTLMAMQAGLPPLDFSGMEGRGRKRYIAAVHAALNGDYQPMERVFARIIARTRKAAP